VQADVFRSLFVISWELLFAIIPGIILFPYGIEQFSHEVWIAEGDYFQENLIHVEIVILLAIIAINRKNGSRLPLLHHHSRFISLSD